MTDVATRIKLLYERNPDSRRIVGAIRRMAERASSKVGEPIKIMNFCGTHEWTISYYGLRSLMPSSVELVAGPGCPVCVTPGSYVEQLAKLSTEGYTILTYGDAYRLPSLPTSRYRSLEHARSLGGKVEVVYSFVEVLKIARERRSENFIFFAVGFETTIPSTSIPLYAGVVPGNLLILTAYRLTPPIMRYLVEKQGAESLHGVIAPGHVSAVLGSNAWRFLPEEFSIPTVVAGFEPVDVLLAVLEILRQLAEGKPRLVNEYTRVVKPEGNEAVKKFMWYTHRVVDAYWRGVGVVPRSGVELQEKFARWSAKEQLGLRDPKEFEDVLPGCLCGAVVMGRARPIDCPLFLRKCTPDRPYGPCMVSSEGTCRIWAENMPLELPV